MYEKVPFIKTTNLDEFVKETVLVQAVIAANDKSYGVGGVLANKYTGELIKKMRNTVISRESNQEASRLKDPTAHGERQLVDWYFENKELLGLPEVEDIVLVTSLDPCIMCTGSILSAGFSVIVSALDDNAGINWDNTYTFKPLQGSVLKAAKETFIYPKVIGDSSRQGYGNVPYFETKFLNGDTPVECFDVFINGANSAREIVEKPIPKDQLIDLSINPNQDIINALQKECPYALKYKSQTGTNIPDKGLACILVSLVQEDIQNGGDGDAVAFLDVFGNLLMCQAGHKNISPIRSAFMVTERTYQKVRYELTKYNENALKYLCDPSLGSFIFVKGFDKSAESFADIGAYGSTLLNEPCDNNLQYIQERIPQKELTAYIAGLPSRYSARIKPVKVSNVELANAIAEF